MKRLALIPSADRTEDTTGAGVVMSPDEQVAKRFHEAYERLAPSYGYETRKESAVPWEDVPEKNRALMIAVCGEVARDLAVLQEWADQAAELAARLSASALNGKGGTPAYWQGEIEELLAEFDAMKEEKR